MALARSVAGVVAVLATLAGAACVASDQTPAPTAPPTSAAASEPSMPNATATLVPVGPSAPATAIPTAEPTSRPPAPPTAVGPSIPDDLRGVDVERIPTSDRIVALTFDAGGNADAVARILATLADEGVPATFFLTGGFVRQFPDESSSIAASGHRLANHSATHPEFTPLTSGQIRDEVRVAERDILGIAGADPRPLFRFPFGDRDARTIEAINDLGYVAVRWTVDTLGWQGTSGGRSADEVTQRVVNTAGPGQIVLMHVGSHPTDGSMLDADALPDVIATLRAAGYRFVTLDALLK